MDIVKNIVKVFVENDLKSKPRVFLDMDGVLVNWNKGYIERLQKTSPDIIAKSGYDVVNDTPHDFERKLEKYFLDAGYPPKKAGGKAKKEFWKPIHGDIDFWINLEWMPDGQELFEYCKSLKENHRIKELNILSSPSSDDVCEKGKRIWLANQGLEKYLDQIIIFKDKYKYATGPLDILIDDTPPKLYGKDNKDPTKERKPGWVDAGGTGILHTDTKSSIEQLNKILGL